MIISTSFSAVQFSGGTYRGEDKKKIPDHLRKRGKSNTQIVKARKHGGTDDHSSSASAGSSQPTDRIKINLQPQDMPNLRHLVRHFEAGNTVPARCVPRDLLQSIAYDLRAKKLTIHSVNGDRFHITDSGQVFKQEPGKIFPVLAFQNSVNFAYSCISRINAELKK